MRLVDLFAKGLERGKEHIAFIEGDCTYTWGEMDELSRQVSAALIGKGLPEHARVAVYSPNNTLAFVAILAIFRAGAIWVPVNARNTVEANEHWFRLMDCHCLFFHSTVQAEALALRSLVAKPALLVNLDEGGSNSVPCLRTFIEEGGDTLPEVSDDDDRLASVFPTGGIARHRVTHLYLPPTLLYMLLAHPDVRRIDYSSLKYLVLAAAPVAPSKFREAAEVFGPVIEFGLRWALVRDDDRRDCDSPPDVPV